MMIKTIGNLTDEEWQSTNCIAVDVDGTLVLWENELGPGDPGGNFKSNQKLIDRIIKWKCGDIGRRQFIVWSGNGRDHAVKMLLLIGLLGITDHIMSKPTLFFEDRPDWFEHTTTVIDVREHWDD